MLHKLTRVLAVAAMAAGLTTAVPLPSQAAPGPCPARFVSEAEGSQTIAVAGFYRADGYEVRLTCGIVQNGVTVARLTDDLFGPVAALAETVEVPAGAFTTCYDVYITYINGASSTRTCP